jgi:hypothetical protein
MSTLLEERVFRLETLVQAIQQQILAIQTQLGTLAQIQWAASAPAGGGGGGSGNFLACCPTAGIAASGGCAGTGAPGGPLTGQTIYQVNGGAWASLTTNGTVYNGMEASGGIVAGKTLVVQPNPDGTYTGVTQSC